MNFDGFSPESFEQLIRALALEVFGPEVTIFGNGPDGGREATFNGTVNYPDPPNPMWSGYGVIQAKYKEKKEGTQKDQQWALRQLQDEIEKWASKTKRMKKPDYFVFCTNVELSSAENGAKDLAKEWLESNLKFYNLKGFAVWDCNQLLSIIDTKSEIRRRFTHFFTPGDLLAEYAKAISGLQNPEGILAKYLTISLLAEGDTRITQAGSRTDENIDLASVFMDLRSTPFESASHFELDEEENHSKLGSVRELLIVGSYKLDPLAIHENQTSGQSERHSHCPLLGRFIYFGGPGSGKSTIGQFLSQIHRAALLDRLPVHRIEEKVRKAIKGIKNTCMRNDLPWPTVPRYVFRVELNSFAKTLAANDKRISLSDYLRSELSKDIYVTHESLRDWLRHYPWLLILDGLDEVPSSSNRKDVVHAIRSFLIETKDLEADILVVASSRLEGYLGEFDDEDIAPRYLSGLTKKEALKFSECYLKAKYGTEDHPKVVQDLAILAESIENKLVSKLMKSPLQVTFMVIVVDTGGTLSESRWRLFHDYYNTIYSRERQKAVIPFNKVMSTRRTEIDKIHRLVGMSLQLRGESAGGTQSELSLEEFRSIVNACLSENEINSTDLEVEQEMIIETAKTRLVFLTSKTSGQLTFDVRSLQEYVASLYLTDNDSSEIIPRLQAIGQSSYWRNTLLFAIERFFEEAHLDKSRDKIRTLCENINLADQVLPNVFMGSLLALEILENGIVGNRTTFELNLADCALKLLNASMSSQNEFPAKLSKVYKPSFQHLFKTEISRHLGQQSVRQTLAAWMTLLHLESKEVDWAMDLVQKNWPTEASYQYAILQTWINQFDPKEDIIFDETPFNSNISQRITTLVPILTIAEACILLNHRFMFSEDSPPWIIALKKWVRKEKHKRPLKPIGNQMGYEIVIEFIIDSRSEEIQPIQALFDIDPLNIAWKRLESLFPFLLYPSPETLKMALGNFYARSIADADLITLFKLGIPWPLISILYSFSENPNAVSSSEIIAENINRQFDRWLKMEYYWKTNFVPFQALYQPIFKGDPSIKMLLSFFRISSTYNSPNSNSKNKGSDELLRLTSQAIEQQHHQYAIIANDLYDVLCLESYEQNIDAFVTPKWFKKFLLPSFGSIFRQSYLIDFSGSKWKKGWIELFNEIANLPDFQPAKITYNGEESLHDISYAYERDNSKSGLLRILSGIFYSANNQFDLNIDHAMKRKSPPTYRTDLLSIRLLQGNLEQEEELMYVAELIAYAKNGLIDAARFLINDTPISAFGINNVMDDILHIAEQVNPEYLIILQENKQRMLKAKRSDLKLDEVILNSSDNA